MDETARYDQMVEDLLKIADEMTATLGEVEGRAVSGVIFSIAEFVSETRGSGEFRALDAMLVQRGLTVEDVRREMGLVGRLSA